MMTTDDTDECPVCGRETVAAIQSWEIGVEVVTGDVCSVIGRFPHRYYVHAESDQ